MRIWVAALLSGVSTIAAASPAYAQTSEYNIPAGSLKSALDAYAKRTGAEILAKEDELRGVRSPGARGTLSNKAALDAILWGTGFRAEHDVSGAVAIVKASADPKVDADDNAIIVTGSRIRGVESASPLITKSANEMLKEGQTNLGDYARSLPQSFGGGQNPGVIGSQGSTTNQNVTNGSSFNLRGLGPDATLTLLNGHRVAYDGTFQAVDVSAIPVAAIERIEVVADGASAIYGSDAVGGVANIILKRDYDGVTTGVRFGASTDGGNVRQQYSAVAGTTWNDGGIIATIDYGKNSAIYARQRSYTETLSDGQTLFPKISQFNAIFSGHQKISDHITMSVDATFSDRDGLIYNARTATLAPTFEGTTVTAATKSFSVSPRLEIDLDGDWSLALSGTHATSRTFQSNYLIRQGAFTSDAQGLIRPSTNVAELSAEGPLFALNGNDVRVALGGGFRQSGLRQHNQTITPAGVAASMSYDGTTSSWYGYGELSVPVIMPLNDGPFHQLSFTAAARYENYGRSGEILTPKFGAIFAPISGVKFRASWGRSFKSPQLIQQYFANYAFYQLAENFGGPRGGTDTVIYLLGGNPSLRSERAKSWNVGVAFEPAFLADFRAEVNYFEITYKDRIAEPFFSTLQAFSTPGYASLISFNPTIAEIDSAIASSFSGLLQSTASLPMNPSDVVAIVDGRYANIARQNIRGVDLLGAYRIDLRDAGRLDIAANASYLNSSQEFIPGAAETQLAGTVFDPSHWRGRASATWSKDGFSLNFSGTVSGSFYDDRRTPFVKIGPSTTFDSTARYAIENAGIFSGTTLTLSALNIFNRKPRMIRQSSAVARPYDPTNDSVIGRFIQFSITKHW